MGIEWTQQLEDDVLNDIEAGLTLRQVARNHGMSAAAIIRHVTSDEGFAKQYARAMEVRTDADCDALADAIAEQPAETERGVDSGWVQWKRVQIDTVKWLLSKRNPKKYGDKIANEHSGPNGGAIQSEVTITFVKTKGSNG